MLIVGVSEQETRPIAEDEEDMLARPTLRTRVDHHDSMILRPSLMKLPIDEVLQIKGDKI